MYTVSEIMKDSWSSDYLLLRRYIVWAKGQRGEDVRTNIIIFLPLPILDPWGEQWEKNISLTPTLLQTVYPFKIIPSDTLQPLQPKDETTTKLQRKTRRHQSSKSSQYTTVWIS